MDATQFETEVHEVLDRWFLHIKDVDIFLNFLNKEGFSIVSTAFVKETQPCVCKLRDMR